MAVGYSILYHPAVVAEDVPRLDTAAKRRISAAIESKLATEPDLYGKPLRRSLKGYRKLRVGDYRIVFRIQRSEVRILAIMHRTLIYGGVESRKE